MIQDYLILSVILFCLGILGVVTRRNVFTVFMSIELMLNAANLAFVAFARVPADACVIEVGLGGRFDATNVVARPAICGIASRPAPSGSRWSRTTRS